MQRDARAAERPLQVLEPSEAALFLSNAPSMCTSVLLTAETSTPLNKRAEPKRRSFRKISEIESFTTTSP